MNGLLQPQTSWQPVLTAIKNAGDNNRPLGWRFWKTTPKVAQLPALPRQAAEAFIEYFKGKSNLEELRKKLDALPKQAADFPGNGKK